jgi:hypothetical protein
MLISAEWIDARLGKRIFQIPVTRRSGQENALGLCEHDHELSLGINHLEKAVFYRPCSMATLSELMRRFTRRC